MRQKGFVLIAMSVALVLMLAVMGMAFDFGRIYIARNEAQVFTDAAAMAAAAKLDGTDAGLDRARQAVARLPMRWNLGTKPFTGVVVEFSADRQRGARPQAGRWLRTRHGSRQSGGDHVSARRRRSGNVHRAGA